MSTRSRAGARLRLLFTLSLVTALSTGMVVNQQSAAEAASGASRLMVGERLLPGDSLVSPSGQLCLFMQGDGNLVLLAPGGAVRWHSHTDGNPGAYAQLQPDGNFVVYSTRNVALWNTATDGKGSTYAQVQDDGNFVVYNGATPVWESGTRYYPSRMGVGVLTGGQALQSPNGQYKAVLQGDGNFVLYGPNGWIWESRTAGTGVTKLALQPDGNMVLYSPAAPQWQTGTDGNGDGAYLQVQDDGNMVLYNSAGQWIWQTNTAGGVHSGIPAGRTVYSSRMGVGVLGVGGVLESPNGLYSAILQGDGNFVLYGPNGWMWESRTAGTGVTKLALQPDGNMVLYSPAAPQWQSGTGGNGDGAYLQVQDDGNMVLYNSSGRWIWQTYTDPSSSGGAPSSTAQIVINYAMQQLGKPYVWGANGPNAFDCSGLTQKAWAAAGVTIPRVSSGQYISLPKVPKAQRRPGDILAWGDDTSDGRSVYHVAIYIGGNSMIEAPAPGGSVRVAPVREANLMPYVLRPVS